MKYKFLLLMLVCLVCVSGIDAVIYGDDFEDDSINYTIWANKTWTQSGGSFANKESDGKLNLNMNNSGPAAKSFTSIADQYDLSHFYSEINFTYNTTIIKGGSSEGALVISICQESNNLIYDDFTIDSNDCRRLYFSRLNQAETNLSIEIEDNNATLYNYDGTMNVTNIQGTIDITGLSKRYVVFSLIAENPDAALDRLYLDLYDYNVTSNEFKELSQTFNSTTKESDPESFILNMTYNSSAWSSISAKLNYNNTNHTGIVSQIGNEQIISTNLTNSLEDAGEVTNSFYWIITLGNATGFYDFESSSNEQIVSSINISYCTDESAMVNLTTYDMENPNNLLNATMKIKWSIKVYGGDNFKDSNFSDTTEANNSWAFCIEPPDSNYTISAEIEYDAADYAKNFYYINNLTYKNDTMTNISLYLLNDSQATLTVLNARDGSQNPMENVYIQIQRYDIGTDTYYTVGMAKTNFNGEDLAYLNWYDTLYKFILTRDSTTLLSTSPYKVSETPQIFEIVTETLFDFEKFRDFEYNLYFNESTNNFVLTFTKPSGDVDSGCLRVIKRNQTDDYNICLTCETSSSATVYCNIAGEGNGTYIATFYATGSLKFVDTISEIVGSVNEVYDLIGNEDGTVMAIIFAGTVMALFLVSPVMAVIGMLLGMIGAIAMGFQPLDYYTFLGIVIVGGIVVWFLKR